MDHPSNLRLQLREAFERGAAELRAQGEQCELLKAKLSEVVHAVESGEEDEAKKLMSEALDFEFNWLLDCEISAPLAEFLGYDEEE